MISSPSATTDAALFGKCNLFESDFKKLLFKRTCGSKKAVRIAQIEFALMTGVPDLRSCVKYMRATNDTIWPRTIATALTVALKGKDSVCVTADVKSNASLIFTLSKKKMSYSDESKGDVA